MTDRQRRSRDRQYRYVSISLFVVTAIMLVPASWIAMPDVDLDELEPEARPIEIVRLPPETLPPPPPLPPKPEPKPPEPEPEPEREPEPEPEPEPKLELVRFEPEIPDVEVPEDKIDPAQRVEIASEVRNRMDFERDLPDVDVPTERAQDKPKARVSAEDRRVERRMDEVKVTVPESITRDERVERLQVAEATAETFTDTEAPDLEIATPRPSTRSAPEPAKVPPSQQLKTGVAVKRAADAPAVEVPRGNTAKPSRSAPVAVSGAFSGSKTVYDQNPGQAPEVAVPSPSASGAPGPAPSIAVTKGGESGLKYSAAPADASIGGTVRKSAAPTKLDSIAEQLSASYGMSFQAVSFVQGERSTEAQRWNVLLPQISEMLRDTRGLGPWRGAGNDEVVAVEREGKRLIIRYRDGIVHVLVPSESGLAHFFVGREKGSRPVVSKVQEAESARDALHRYTRGAS